MRLSRDIDKREVMLLIEQQLEKMHQAGPVSEEVLETFSYAKEMYPSIFKSYERTLMYEMGLFHKTKAPGSIMELVYETYKRIIKEDKGKLYSPVQYSALKNIENNQIFSFSAPTSSGKSYLFRDILKGADYDVVVVLPSRALIGEYIREIKKIVPKDTLVLQFIEDINKDKTIRRIYVITPERAMDLYALSNQLNVKLILFDEAQLIEDEHRGLRFDEMVRLCREYLPDAKLVFAHPFVENPEAQLKRNSLEGTQSKSKVYQQQGVGKIFMFYNKSNQFFYFSPYEKVNRQIEAYDVILRAIENNGSVLIYVSKNELYTHNYIQDFARYMQLCGEVTDENALKIIEQLHEYIGGTKDGEDKSMLLELMRRGIVIHHGSMPLKARMLIEKFVNSGYARICLATSTLMQGINMPFDVVWVDSFYFPDQKKKTLDFKNLIGRAGRTTNEVNSFDYGYVVISAGHRSAVREILKDKVKLSDASLIEAPIENVPIESRDIVEAIQNRSYDTELQITDAQKQRLIERNSNEDVRQLLEKLFDDETIISGDTYNSLPPAERDKIKQLFQTLYIKHLRRTELSSGEKRILSTSIPIMLWRVQGKPFREIIALRKRYIMFTREKRETERNYANHILSEAEYIQKMVEYIGLRYTTIADTLPQNSEYRGGRLFEEDEPFDYDKLVYDTYDYLDKVISFSISTPISAAVMMYYKETQDTRALKLYHYLRYGTDDSKQIMLCRYGFELDDMNWLCECIDSVNENRIVFNGRIDELDEDRKELIKRYL